MCGCVCLLNFYVCNNNLKTIIIQLHLFSFLFTIETTSAVGYDLFQTMPASIGLGHVVNELDDNLGIHIGRGCLCQCVLKSSALGYRRPKTAQPRINTCLHIYIYISYIIYIYTIYARLSPFLLQNGDETHNFIRGASGAFPPINTTRFWQDWRSPGDFFLSSR